MIVFYCEYVYKKKRNCMLESYEGEKMIVDRAVMVVCVDFVAEGSIYKEKKKHIKAIKKKEI